MFTSYYVGPAVSQAALGTSTATTGAVASNVSAATVASATTSTTAANMLGTAVSAATADVLVQLSSGRVDDGQVLKSFALAGLSYGAMNAPVIGGESLNSLAGFTQGSDGVTHVAEAVQGGFFTNPGMEKLVGLTGGAVVQTVLGEALFGRDFG